VVGYSSSPESSSTGSDADDDGVVSPSEDPPPLLNGRVGLSDSVMLGSVLRRPITPIGDVLAPPGWWEWRMVSPSVSMPPMPLINPGPFGVVVVAEGGRSRFVGSMCFFEESSPSLID